VRQALRDRRKYLKLTQAQVAARAGLKRPRYAMIELGLRDPSVAIAQRIAHLGLLTTTDSVFEDDVTARHSVAP
jgi:transcriptional regulator with XRE-family HTH domain